MYLYCSDLLEETEQLQLWPTSTAPAPCGNILLDTSFSHPSLILASSSHSLESLCLLDLASKNIIFKPQPSEKDDHSCCVHYSSFLPGAEADSNKLLVTCSGLGGQINIWDWRVSPEQAAISLAPITPLSHHNPFAYSLAVRDVGATPSSSSVQLARLSASGRLDLFDARNLDCALARANVTTDTTSCNASEQLDLAAATNVTRFSQGSDQPLPCVKVVDSITRLYDRICERGNKYQNELLSCFVLLFFNQKLAITFSYILVPHI